MGSKITSVVALIALLFSMMLGGCKAILQPERGELTGATIALLDSGVRLELDLAAEAGKQRAYYGSSVYTQAGYARWSGSGIVGAGSLFFRQNCETICTSTGESYKYWRADVWTPTDTASPESALLRWNELVQEGEGHYRKQAVIPAEEYPVLSSLTKPAYVVALYHVPISWNLLCDLDIDSFLGGDTLLTQFAEGTIQLFYDAENYNLTGVWLESSLDEGERLRLAIMVSSATETPETFQEDTGALEIREDGALAEEWSLMLPEEPTGLSLPVPDKNIQAQIESAWMNEEDIQIGLGERIICLPCTGDELMTAGCTISNPYSSITPGETRLVDCTYGEDTFAVYLYNSGKETAIPADCQVMGVLLFWETMAHTPVILPGGLPADASPEERLSAWGEPSGETYLVRDCEITVFTIGESSYGIEIILQPS